MMAWEDGYAYVERSIIVPILDTRPVIFDNRVFNVVTGPVRFERSSYDPFWAIRVEQISALFVPTDHYTIYNSHGS